MTDTELFKYVVRDRKWRNGYLCIMAEALCKGEPIEPFLDKSGEGDDKKFNKWLKNVKKEHGEG